MKYHCPKCGSLLQKHERDPQAELSRAEDRWADGGYEGDAPEGDFSESWLCIEDGCVVGGTRFTIHHPFRGLDSAPGESWSMSWVK